MLNDSCSFSNAKLFHKQYKKFVCWKIQTTKNNAVTVTNEMRKTTNLLENTLVTIVDCEVGLLGLGNENNEAFLEE